MPLFFYIALEEVILMRANPFLGPVEGMGPETLDFFGPLNGPRFARGHFRAYKSLEFPGPSLLLALEIDVARIKITSSRAI